jgi:hypothetical protein
MPTAFSVPELSKEANPRRVASLIRSLFTYRTDWSEMRQQFALIFQDHPDQLFLCLLSS